MSSLILITKKLRKFEHTRTCARMSASALTRKSNARQLTNFLVAKEKKRKRKQTARRSMHATLSTVFAGISIYTCFPPFSYRIKCVEFRCVDWIYALRNNHNNWIEIVNAREPIQFTCPQFGWTSRPLAVLLLLFSMFSLALNACFLHTVIKFKLSKKNICAALKCKCHRGTGIHHREERVTETD